jgi:hypothetical protein
MLDLDLGADPVHPHVDRATAAPVPLVGETAARALA